MKRLPFLASLFGFRAGAQVLIKRHKEFTAPPNGQCPVCGLVASSFKPSLKEYAKLSPCGPSKIVDGVVLSVCNPWTADDLPRGQQVVCSRCSVVFWQKAESQK